MGWKATVRNPLVWVLALLAISSSVMAFRERTALRDAWPDAVVRFTVALPAGYQPHLVDAGSSNLAISADGSTVAFPALDQQGAQRIYVRRLDEPDARALPGTEDGFIPGFSPDGTTLAFWAAGRVEKVSLDGGAPQVIGEYGNVSSPLQWTKNGDLVFNLTGVPQILHTSATGGDARPIAPLDSARGETLQLFPVALPDGEHMLYESWGTGAAEDARIGVLDLAAGRARRLDLPGTSPLGVLDGRLVYADQTGTLFAVPFDVGSGSVHGRPVALENGVAGAPRGGAVAALSPNGTLVYMGGSQEATLVLADDAGETPLLPVPDTRIYRYPRYSPDGTKVALTVATGTALDVWLADVASGNMTRLSSGGSVNERPEWSPDGKRVLFRTVRGARSAIWWQPADQSAPAVPLLADDSTDYFEAVLTPDGREMVYQQDLGQADLLMRGVEGGGAPVPIATTRAGEDQPRISPDGRWVAYVTTASGGPQVVVQPLPGPGAKVQVSVRGGSEPVWSRDGHQLFYRSEGKFKVADVSGTPTFHVVSQKDFMDDTYLPYTAPHANYDVTPDGKKLLVLEGGRPELVVVHDWAAEVRTKLAQARQEGGR